MFQRISMTTAMVIAFPSLLHAQDGLATESKSWLRDLMPEALKSEIFFLEQWQWLAIAS
ncbi:MAG: hypothetical protein HRU16_01630, partial [Planctomycetes bacterium]|nr:hypothetical protein [Planctomycetota bacterium]